MTPGRLTQEQFDRQLWRAIIPPLVLLAAHAAIVTVLLIHWLQMSSHSQNADRVLLAAKDVQDLLVNMETGGRGYLLSGQEQFLEPLTRAKQQIENVLADLRQGVETDTAQRDRLARFEQLLIEWSGVEVQLRQASTTQPRASNFAQILNDQRAKMDEMRGVLRDLISTESQRHAAQSQREQSAALTAIIGAIGVSIMAGIGLALINRRNVYSLSQQYQRAVEEQAESSRQLLDAQKQIERERETMLEAERTARSNLLRANQIKDQFLATLSHELRTPMSAILGWARLLRDPVVRTQKLDRALEAIDANAKAQARLIDDLLDMTRIASGKLTINAENVDLRKVVRAAFDAISLAAMEKGIKLSAKVEDQDPVIVHGDPARLQQIVWNLLTNALKFTPGGGSVSLSLLHHQGGARIVISDTGRGINPQFLPQVFDRFRQEDGAMAGKQAGLGLGLAIVKHLVEMHQGTVAAQSDGEGRGATFTIDLPRPSPQLAAISTAPTPVTDVAVIRNKRILVVDDDRSTALVTQTVLEGVGAAAQTVFSAREAIELISRHDYDVLISDIAMPDMDGYAMMRQVRELKTNGARLPSIALTGFARPDDRDAALRAGYDAHVCQPVTPEQLLRAVAEVLNGHSSVST